MAYSDSRLTCLADYKVMKVWLLDTVDAVATLDTAGYISDAATLGMSKGDEVKVRVWTTAIPAATSELKTAAGVANVLADAATMVVMGLSAAGAADLADETAITVTNTD